MKEKGKLSKELTQSLGHAEHVMHSMERYSMERMEGLFQGQVDRSVLDVETDDRIDLDEWYLYRIDELVYSEKEGLKREAIENVLGTFRGMDEANILYMILGDAQKVNIYMGVSKNLYHSQDSESGITQLGVKSYAQHMIEPSLKGNFTGSKITEQTSQDKASIMKRIQSAKYAGYMNGVPGFIEKHLGENKDFQGAERLIDTMVGSEFGVIVIARACNGRDVLALTEQINQLHNELEPLAKITKQETLGNQWNYSTNESENISKNVGTSKSTDQSESVGRSESDSVDTRQDTSFQLNASKSDSASDQEAESTSYGESYSNPKQYSKSDGRTTNNGSSSNTNSTSDSSSISETVSADDSVNYQYNASTNITNTSQWSKTNNSSDGYTNSKHISNSNDTRTSRSENISVQKNHSKSKGSGESDSSSTQTTYSLEASKKVILNWLKYLDETFMTRIDKGKSKGSFEVASYLFTSQNPATLYRLANTMMSLYGGEKGNVEPLGFIDLTDNKNRDNVHAKQARHIFENLQLPVLNSSTSIWKSAFSKLPSRTNKKESIGTWLTVEELGIMMGMPQREVLGLAARNEVEYGLNMKDLTVDASDEYIELGALVHHGEIREQNKVYLEKANLSKHTFICGVTGSGKTTTCQSILMNADLPFLVIEPAKTEYRTLMHEPGGEDILYFTLGRQDIAPFFLNPFEILPGESITSRADMLKASFISAFEMEAAIPQIIEAATYEVYEKKGWDVRSSKWINPLTGQEEDPFVADSFAFPTITDYLGVVEEVVDRQGFDERLKNDYIGSLKARLQALTVGSKGMMLDTPRSIDFKDLVTKKVVIELEEIKDGTEKSLIMGFIITNLLEAIKYQYERNNTFQHITLVEEAHRLLSRYEPGDSLNKKRGVEIFADMLAEVRKYGESLIIVDQIPNKMTPEVLKNTNTKIVHKIFAKDDKEAIGNTMALSEDQRDFLSYLETGRAVVITEGWKKPVQVKITPRSQTDDKKSNHEMGDIKEWISKKCYEYYAKHNHCGVIPGFSSYEGKLTSDMVEEYLTLLREDSFFANDNLKNFLLSGCYDSTAEGNAKQQFRRFFFETYAHIMKEKVVFNTNPCNKAFCIGQLQAKLGSEFFTNMQENFKELFALREKDETHFELQLSNIRESLVNKLIKYFK
jgi:hypothetical protein